MARNKSDRLKTAQLINSGAIHVLRGLRYVDRHAGVGPARLSALSVLAFGGPRTLGQLAELEEVAGPTMTRIVDGLCAQGLAERTPHPRSRRAVLVSATPAGAELMHVAADRRAHAISAALRQLDSTEQEALHAAAPALVRLATALTAAERARLAQ